MLYYYYFFQKPLFIIWCSKFVVLMQIIVTFDVKIMKSYMSRELFTLKDIKLKCMEGGR